MPSTVSPTLRYVNIYKNLRLPPPFFISPPSFVFKLSSHVRIDSPSLPPSLPPFPQEQIRAYVYDVVRATLPRMLLDEAFEAKDDIAHAIKTSLQTCMGTYGYSILVCLSAYPPSLPLSLPPSLPYFLLLANVPEPSGSSTSSHPPSLSPSLPLSLPPPERSRHGPGARSAGQGGHE